MAEWALAAALLPCLALPFAAGRSLGLLLLVLGDSAALFHLAASGFETRDSLFFAAMCAGFNLIAMLMIPFGDKKGVKLSPAAAAAAVSSAGVLLLIALISGLPMVNPVLFSEGEAGALSAMAALALPAVYRYFNQGGKQ